MTIIRRFLPSMPALTAFEAAARHQSFTVAATELNLTQSAVSRQIRTLEDVLGSELFLRERQTVRLTQAGEVYAREIRRALGRISEATLGFRANPRGGTLNLAILPTFGTRWLAPRLPDFAAENPGVTINLSTHLSTFDFDHEQVDAAIHFGQPEWPGAELAFLMHETVIPACGPALLETNRVESPEDLLNLPLLHLTTRPDAWERWFRAHEVNTQGIPGMLVDQFATAAQAAIAGMGVALLPRFLIESELARGDLVEPVKGPVRSIGAYYLAWSSRHAAHPPLQAFRDWILRAVAKEGAPVSSDDGLCSKRAGSRGSAVPAELPGHATPTRGQEPGSRYIYEASRSLVSHPPERSGEAPPPVRQPQGAGVSHPHEGSGDRRRRHLRQCRYCQLILPRVGRTRPS